MYLPFVISFVIKLVYFSFLYLFIIRFEVVK